MATKELNLGILAHVDAGKTTLTERLLYDAGAIDRLGSVDAGTTQTDSLALERQRGITIRSAVASFGLGDVHVNLIDTPGHPDFIAEVERVLNVLDGAVLVISGVEGVQPQTRILMRALQRLRIPTLVVREQARPARSRCRACPARHLGAIDDSRCAKRDARRPAGRGACGTRRRDHGGVRRRRGPRAATPSAGVARGSDGAGARAPGLLRLRRDGRRPGLLAGRDHRPAAGWRR